MLTELRKEILTNAKALTPLAIEIYNMDKAGEIDAETANRRVRILRTAQAQVMDGVKAVRYHVSRANTALRMAKTREDVFAVADRIVPELGEK